MQFAAVSGTFVDFRVLDLSPWGIQGAYIESPRAENSIRSISLKDHDEINWQDVKQVTQSAGEGGGLQGEWEHMNLLWPLDLNNPPSENDYFEAIEALRVIHPSEMYIRNILGVHY